MQDNRGRLLTAFADAVEARGFAAVTVAEIVRRARVSRRTFYQHFSDKEECFMAAYEAAAAQAQEAIERAVEGAGSWQEKIRASVAAYVYALEERPALSRAFLLEIQAAGRRTLKLRRRVLTRFADQARALAAAARRAHPGEVLVPTASMALAIVGGVNELLLFQLENRADLGEVAETATRLWLLALTGTPRRRRPL